MIKKLAMALMAITLLSPNLAFSKEKSYKTEANAIKYCKGDTVVWVNTDSNIYHLSDSQHYGNTTYGYYMCKKSAERDGNRPAKSK